MTGVVSSTEKGIIRCSNPCRSGRFSLEFRAFQHLVAVLERSVPDSAEFSIYGSRRPNRARKSHGWRGRRQGSQRILSIYGACSRNVTRPTRRAAQYLDSRILPKVPFSEDFSWI